MTILFVVSEEGYWGEECVRPLKKLRNAGYETEIATPSREKPVIDRNSINPNRVGEDEATEIEEFHRTDDQLNTPISIVEAIENDYEAIVFPGGHGTVFDINHDVHARRLLSNTLENNGKALIICHAVGILGFATDEDGEYIANGKEVTGFPNEWEDQEVDALERREGIKLPYRVEDEVILVGAEWDAELDEETSVKVDGNLITARGPDSAAEAAETLIEEL